MAHRVEVTVSVPLSEYESWEAQAKRYGMPVAEWLRRVGNFVLAAEVEGTREVTTGRRRMLAAVAMKCAWCGGGLGTDRSIRRIYCTDSCRVLAWRMRQRVRRGLL
jgi:hypothetical protein